MVKGVVPDDVPRQAGGTAQAVGVGFFAGLAAARQGRAVGHLQHIGHVAGGRGVQNGHIHAVVPRLQHPGVQEAGVEHHGLAGLQVDLHPVALPQAPHQGDQLLPVVVLPGDVVAAPQIEPLQALEIGTELLLEGHQSGLQVVGVLLAQGVEVKPVQQGQLLRPEIGQSGAQPGAGGAGVIDGVALLGGALGVHPQAHLLARFPGPPGVLLQLLGGVEHKVVGVLEQLGKLLLPVGGRKDVDLAGEVLLPQPGLVKAAGGAARQIPGDHGVGVEHREGLLGQEDLGAGGPGHLLEDLQVPFQKSLIHHKGGGGQGSKLLHQSTSTGLSLICQGRPHLFRASM